MADLIFRLINIGVTDLKKDVKTLTTLIYDNRSLIDQLTEIEVREWILKVYNQLMEASGIQNKHPRKKSSNPC